MIESTCVLAQTEVAQLRVNFLQIDKRLRLYAAICSSIWLCYLAPIAQGGSMQVKRRDSRQSSERRDRHGAQERMGDMGQVLRIILQGVGIIIRARFLSSGWARILLIQPPPVILESDRVCLAVVLAGQPSFSDATLHEKTNEGDSRDRY